MRITTLVCFILLLAGCQMQDNAVVEKEVPVDIEAAKTEINNVLDDWHKAAAESDFERYFGHFASDSSIFMGTDATEHWNVPEFKDYAREPFANNSGWVFVPFERHVYLSKTGNFSWFSELLKSEAYGVARGSGALIKTDSTWKLTQYNLSVPIPNSMVNGITDQIKSKAAHSNSNE